MSLKNLSHLMKSAFDKTIKEIAQLGRNAREMIYRRRVLTAAATEELRRRGMIQYKEWRIDEAERLGVTPSCIAGRIARGEYDNLKIRRVNKRVVFVKP